jgi:hypothetical protein
LEDMTFGQIEDLFAELDEEEISALLEDTFTLRDPGSAHEMGVRALRFSRFLHVEDAEIVELHRTTLGEVGGIVNMLIENVAAPVWYVEISGIMEPRGPPVVSPEGAMRVCSGIRMAWEAKPGGKLLGHQPRGPCMLRLRDGSIVPYPTPMPTRLHTVTATPGGPPIPIMPTVDPSAPTPQLTQTPTDTPVPTATP